MQKVNLAEKLAQFDSHWDPHVVADYNDNEVMVVKFQGEFPFHSHPDTDDFFLVIEGEILLDVEDNTLTLGPGELAVVPRGKVHRPRALREAFLRGAQVTLETPWRPQHRRRCHRRAKATDLMPTGARNLITDVPGLLVGQAQDDVIKTGVTVLTSDAPFLAAVHIMGGAPGTRETDLLKRFGLNLNREGFP